MERRPVIFFFIVVIVGLFFLGGVGFCLFVILFFSLFICFLGF